MKSYLNAVKYVMDNGVRSHNRTGIDTFAVSGYMLQHDMKDGFPLLTSKKMGLKSVCAELEMFIKGIHSKKFLQDRKCKIWNEWCSPDIVPYGNDEETLAKMAVEDELGPIYGFQYRHFNGDYKTDLGGVDQLKGIIDTIKTDPTSRRLVVSAWNPQQLQSMALPPCHMIYEIVCYPNDNAKEGEPKGKMDLLFMMRSVDMGLGFPYDIASYAMLLTLIAKETGYEPGKVIAFLGNTHIYENQIDKLKEQLNRPTHKLPTVEITNWTSIWDWNYDDFILHDYVCEGPLKMDVAV